MLQTRGYKVIVRMMPHEVADLEPVLAMLANQNPMDFEVKTMISFAPSIQSNVWEDFVERKCIVCCINT